MRSPLPDEFSTDWLPAVIAALFAFALLAVAAPQATIRGDSVRDQLLARDCVELGRCHALGPPTSVEGIHQGVLWVDVLAGVRRLGGDAGTARVLVFALNAAAIGLLFAGARAFRTALAWPTAMFALAAIFALGETPYLVNASAVLLPDSLAAIALLRFSSVGSLPTLLSGAFAVAVGMNEHVESASLAPAVLLLAVLAGRRPLLQFASAAGVIGAVNLLVSRKSWIENFEEIQRRHFLLPCIVGFGVAMTMSALARSRFARMGAARRLGIVAAAAAVPCLVGVAQVWLFEKVAITPYYLSPLVPVASLIAASFLIRLPRRLVPGAWPAIGAMILAAVLRKGADSRREWTYSQARAVADQLAADGWEYGDAAGRIDAPDCRELVAGLKVYMPEPRDPRRVPHGDAGLEALGVRLKDVAKSSTLASEDVSPERFLFSERADPRGACGIAAPVRKSAVLDRRAESGFTKLIGLAESGQLGDDVRSANVSISGDEARVALVLRRSGERSVNVRRAGLAGARSTRYFTLNPEPGALTSDVDRIAARIDGLFANDPFVLAADGTDADIESVPRDGWAHWADPSLREYVWMVLIGVAIGLAACAAVATRRNPEGSPAG